MKFRISILKLYTFLFLAWCVVHTVFNYEQLSGHEGWGIVAMIGLVGFGMLLFIVDIILNNLVKNRLAANLAGLTVAAAFTILVYREFF